MRVIERLNTDTRILDNSISGIEVAENAGAAIVIIVDANNEAYRRWNHQSIKQFAEIDRKLFRTTATVRVAGLAVRHSAQLPGP